MLCDGIVQRVTPGGWLFSPGTILADSPTVLHRQQPLPFNCWLGGRGVAGAVRYAVHLSKATCVASSFFCEHERTGFGVSANLTCSGISASGRAAGPRESHMFSFARNCHPFLSTYLFCCI